MSSLDRETSVSKTEGVPISKVATDIRGLDEILKGGVPIGRITVIGGRAGTGKTVFAMEFLYRGALKNEPGVFISFEEREDDLRSNFASLGMDVASLEKEGKLKIITAEIPHHAVRAGEFDIQGLLSIIVGHTRSLGAHRVVLDAIDVLMRIFGDIEREREELYILHDRLRDLGLTTLLTAKTDTNQTLVYPFLDFMSDCVLCLDQRLLGQVRTRRLMVMKYRGSNFLSNEYPYIISSKGVVIMPVSNLSLVQKVTNERLSSGNHKLDRRLDGGYFRGSCILVSGPSGSGKTTLVSTFAEATCHAKERVLYVNFEQADETVLLEMSSVGVDLRSAYQAGTLRMLSALPESAGVEHHLFWILDTIEEFAPHHIVVDAISAFSRMGTDQAAFELFIRLLTVCKEKGITCLFTKQYDSSTEINNISLEKITSLVDTLIAIQYLDDGKTLRRNLLVIKSRGMAHSLHYVPMSITKSGIDFNLQEMELSQ